MTVVAAGAMVSASFLVSYEWFVAHLSGFTVDRSADLSYSEFDAFVWRLRIAALGFALLAVGVIAIAGTVNRVLDEVAREWWSSVRHAPRLLRRWIADEHAATLAAGGIVLICAVAVRIAFLDVPLRYDEATTYDNFVSKPLYVGLANYATPNNHLLHTFLAKVSVTIFGSEPWAIRLPALVAGVTLVPATFALARMLYGRIAALLAAALVAASSTLVEYSTNARGYTLVALATAVAFIGAALALERDAIGAWAVVAVSGTLGLYAVPIMIYPLGGVLAWILVSGWLAGRPVRLLLTRIGGTALVATVFTLVLYAPVYAASGVGAVTANEFVEPRSWSTLVELAPGHVSNTVETWTRDLPFAAAVLVGVGLLAGLASTPWISRFRVPALLSVVAWAVAVLAVQRVVPYTRVWLFLVPLAAATAAGFFGWALERRLWTARAGPTLAVVVAVGGSLLVLSSDSVRESRETGALLDAPAIAAFLAERVEPVDRILATGSDTILEYYLERDGVDAGPLLYTEEPRARTFVVVNVLGGQTLNDLVGELDGAELGPPELLRQFESGSVYLVERAA